MRRSACQDFRRGSLRLRPCTACRTVNGLRSLIEKSSKRLGVRNNTTAVYRRGSGGHLPARSKMLCPISARALQVLVVLVCITRPALAPDRDTVECPLLLCDALENRDFDRCARRAFDFRVRRYARVLVPLIRQRIVVVYAIPFGEPYYYCRIRRPYHAALLPGRQEVYVFKNPTAGKMSFSIFSCFSR